MITVPHGIHNLLARHWTKRPAVCVMFVFLSAITGCAEDESRAPSKAEPGPVPFSSQRAGNPEAGYDVLVNGGYVTCGMPYSAWKRAASPPEPVRMLAGRKGINAEMPYSLTVHVNPQGVKIVSNNCLMCHGGLIDGELVIGLGNEWLDFTGDPREFVTAVGTYVSGQREAAAWRKWRQRVSAIAPYMITDTIGVNPAPSITLALIAHRDPGTLAWSEDPLLTPPPGNPIPVSVPPWWRMAKKHAMFYNAMGRGDHARFMMMKSLLCTDSAEEASMIDEMFADVRAYIASLDPPDYPYAIDKKLAERGKTVFERHCARCHGTYGFEGEYPNLVVPLDTIGTDPAYARQAYEESDRFMDWFNRSWYGGIATAQPAPGYIAPPLDGVWATGPFLHNGSIPTIAALLDSSKRPAYWVRDFDSRDFDKDDLGWKYEALEHGKEGADSPERRQRIYDTTLHGYSNAGHTFGDALTDREKKAVIEYLKTL